MVNNVKTIFNLTDYMSPTTETSFYKGIPIEYLNITRKILKSHGYTCKIRYRGPRKNDGRNWFNQKSTCLKSNAVTFTVYTGA